jgi:hypothetical protein
LRLLSNLTAKDAKLPATSERKVNEVQRETDTKPSNENDFKESDIVLKSRK